MTRAREWADEFTPLCESCGYSLEALPAAGACPECGRTIQSSLPSHRRGSPWQQRPGVRAWLSTLWQFIARPRRLHEQLLVGPGASRWLTMTNLLIAGALVALVPAVRATAGRDPIVAWSPASGVLAGTTRAWAIMGLAVAAWLITAAILLLLTWIESLGLRFFHNRRGWRISRSIAWNVCAHASFGWSLGALLMAASWALVDLDIAIARALQLPTLRSRVGDWAAAPVTLAFLAGMILFELRVYQGVRACRYANRSRPAETGPLTPPAGTRAPGP